jgi:hypothetical protein
MDSPDLEDYSENSFQILPVYQQGDTPLSWNVQSRKKVFPLIVRLISLSTKKAHLLGVSFLLGQIIFWIPFPWAPTLKEISQPLPFFLQRS